MTDFKEVENALEKFRDERDWSQFHTVKNLLVALNLIFTT